MTTTQSQATHDNKNIDTRNEWLLALPRLFALAIKLAFDRNIPWETKTTMGAALLYIVSPIDGIPDFIPILGQVEDIAIFLLLVDGIVNHLDRDIVLRHWTGRPDTLESIGRFTSRITRIMPSFIRDRVMKKAFRNNWGPKATATGTAGRTVVDAG